MPGAYRSIHPVNSVIAIGANARKIVSGHEESIYPCGESSPYYKMMRYDAKIIGIGVNTNFLSFVHCPEDIMADGFPVKTRTDKVYNGKVKLSSGEIIEVKTLASHRNIQKRNIPLFIKKHISKEIVSEYKIKGSEFYTANARYLFNRMIELANQGITIYNP
jgi:aminoglycoside N3'-acetyltransferase